MRAQFTTIAWLVKREFWEHKKMFVWTPICVAVLIVIFVLVATAFASGTEVLELRADAVANTLSTQITFTPSSSFTEGERHLVRMATAMSVFGFVAPLLIILALIAFSYCLDTLYSERKDRSVLFWKSLPISDTQTVIAKVVTAVIAVPFIYLMVGLIVSLLIASVFAAVASLAGEHSIWKAMGKSEFYWLPFHFIGVLPVYAIWALPTVGWLMLISALTRTTPFVWAVALPVLIGVVIFWLNQFGNFNWDVKWYWLNIVGRGLGGVMPGSWYWPGDPSEPFRLGTPEAMQRMFLFAWAQFKTTAMWVGAFAGVVMIYAAIQVRRWKDEG